MSDVIDSTSSATPASGTVEAVVAQQPSVAPSTSEGNAPTEVVNPPVEQKVEDPKFASKFAALTRQEKTLREKAAEIEKRTAEISAKQAEIEALRQQEEAWQRKFEEDPVSALEEKGIKWDKVNEKVLNPETEEQKAFKTLKQELQAMKEALAKEKAEAQEMAKKKEEEAYNEQMRLWKTSLTSQFQSGDYPLSNQFATVEVVENLITYTYQNEGRILKNAEACAMVEAFYEDKLKGALSNEKIKSRFGVAQQTVENNPNASGGDNKADASKQQTQTATAKGPAPTLGNKGTPVKPDKPFAEMDDDERKAYLAQKMKVLKGKK